MLFKGKNKSNLTLKLTTASALSIMLSCPYTFADGMFSYFDFEEVPAIKLKSPIYLDTSRAEKTAPKIHTSIPFNLRGNFDEADYFSSNIDDSASTQSVSMPDLMNLPPPSEYKKVNSLANEGQERSAVYSPKASANNFFTPLENNQE